MSTLIGRVLISELLHFSHAFSDVVLKHIEHHQYSNMSKKSETVPLGIIFRNKNVVEDMIDIMLQLHKYVPCEKKTKVDASSGCEVPCDVQHSILFGGDQLTRK
uniref:Uncharacterized protein n=1 Tax=Amphimedon queenslandica TaxID=400682 RepID=A0A1X7SZS6_AMPQE